MNALGKKSVAADQLRSAIMLLTDDNVDLQDRMKKAADLIAPLYVRVFPTENPVQI